MGPGSDVVPGSGSYLVPGFSRTVTASRLFGRSASRLTTRTRVRVIRYTQRMHVELLGVPRERAGVAELDLEADTLGQLLVALVARCPSLGELITADRLQPSIVANVNGDRFVSDPRTQLRKGDSILILSADAGG